MTTLLDHKTTLAYLAYLGYEPAPNSSIQDTTSALKTTPPRRRRRGEVGTVQRNVFLSYVIGAPGSGKTSLLRSLLNKPFTSTHTPSTGISVVNAVEMEGGAEKYLVCQEIDINSNSTKNKKSTIQAADVVVLVYDCSDANSFSYLSQLNALHNLDNIPCIYVATKSDLDLAQQRHEVQPDVYCRRLNLNVPIAVSVKANETASLFQYICAVASKPKQALPVGARKGRGVLHMVSLGVTIGGGLVGLLAILTRQWNWRPWSTHVWSAYRGVLGWWNKSY